MRDEDDGGAPCGEGADRAEQRGRLGRHQHRGGLVEDDDARLAVQDLEDLDALPVADPEVGHERVDVDLEAVLGREGRDPLAGGRRVEAPRGPRLVRQHDVLPHAEGVGEQEVLVHDADAGLLGLTGRPELVRDAVDLDRALVGALLAGQHLHQGGLAGAVLADDRVDGAGAHDDVDPVVGRERPETLDDPGQPDRRLVHRHRVRAPSGR
nr:hypothetical protein GCM10025699_55890 [Microbacterium flavescens]